MNSIDLIQVEGSAVVMREGIVVITVTITAVE